jgi:transcriptional regulator with PAS, ATPase and Fis domain
MDRKNEELLKYLLELCNLISNGRYTKADELFELTKAGTYPRIITDLAEAFGMMMVQVEAREFHLSGIIEDLRAVQSELSRAKEILARENVVLKKDLRERFSPSRILGPSRQMKRILDQVEKIADLPINVLITGETGTGKELIAKAIHYNSGRSHKPFTAVNCSAIPESIYESEIFGIEKGVATGVEKRIGRIESADGGTLFLDEIGEMSLPCQVKILRTIEEREFERVGGRKTISVDVRIVAATNRDLWEEVEKGRFRKDLLYRLNVVHIDIPPLRERKEDIPVLLNFFLEKYSRDMGKAPLRFSPDALAALAEYSWPGNVRELRNEVERAVALAYAGVISREDLSREVREAGAKTASDATVLSLREVERTTIAGALRQSQGNKAKAARILGMSREGLRKKMKNLELT